MLAQLIVAVLLYVLACVCLTTVAGIFGVLVMFTQAVAVLILFSLLVSIVKSF
jgi:hypothetical protein